MKSLYLFLCFFFFCSCFRDVSTQPESTNQQLNNATLPVDSLSYLQLNPLDLGDVKIIRSKLKQLVLINQSNEFAVNVDSLRFMNGGAFYVFVTYGYPVIIPPGGTNPNSSIYVHFDSKNLPVGNYEDYLIINDNTSYKIKVKIRVVD